MTHCTVEKRGEGTEVAHNDNLSLQPICFAARHFSSYSRY